MHFFIVAMWIRPICTVHHTDHPTKQLENLLQKWVGLEKSQAWRITNQVTNEESLKWPFNKLYDMAMMKIEEDEAFLLAQRENGRKVDFSLTKKSWGRTGKETSKPMGVDGKQDTEMINYYIILYIIFQSENAADSDNWRGIWQSCHRHQKGEGKTYSHLQHYHTKTSDQRVICWWEMKFQMSKILDHPSPI